MCKLRSSLVHNILHHIVGLPSQGCVTEGAVLSVTGRSSCFPNPSRNARCSTHPDCFAPQATDVWGHNPVSPFCKDAIQNALHPSALTGVRVRELCKTTFNLPTRPLAASSLAAVSCDEGQGYPGHYGNGFFIGGTITQLTVCCPVPDPTPAPSPEASPSPDPDCDLGPGHKVWQPPLRLCHHLRADLGSHFFTLHPRFSRGVGGSQEH